MAARVEKMIRSRRGWIVGAILSIATAGVTCTLAQDPLLSGGPPLQDQVIVDGVEEAENAKGQNLHEGAELVDMVGVFMMSGERTVFTTDEGSQRFIGLENLNLERIVRMLGESNSQTQWRLSGRVTEYRGSNYLLISRAVRSLSPNISRPVTDLSTGIGALGSGSPAP